MGDPTGWHGSGLQLHAEVYIYSTPKTPYGKWPTECQGSGLQHCREDIILYGIVDTQAICLRCSNGYSTKDIKAICVLTL